MDGKERYMLMDERTEICSSAIAPALPNKLHGCNDAISALPRSKVAVSSKEPGMEAGYCLYGLMDVNY